MNTKYAVSTVAGRVRKQNQDRFYLNGQTMPAQQEDYSLAGQSRDITQAFSVCDGMGGEQYGEVAATLAVESLRRFPQDMLYSNLRAFIRRANEVVYHFEEQYRARAGTTFAGLFLDGEAICAVNVGDSRIYCIRNGAIHQLSKDHTEFQAMVDAGVFQKDDFYKTSSHNRLTQYLGVDWEEMELEPHEVELNALEGDRYLLCSDGLYGVVSDEDIQAVVMDEPDPAKAVERLVQMAEANKSRDNITALLVCLEEAETESSNRKKQSLFSRFPSLIRRKRAPANSDQRR